MLFQEQRYLDAQEYSQVEQISDEYFSSVFVIDNQKAISQKSAPSGGIQLLNHADYDQFLNYWTRCLEVLKKTGVKRVEIVQPPAYYKGFVGSDWLEKVGFKEQVSERNQFVAIDRPVELHHMEMRILQKGSNIRVGAVQISALKEVYEFISTYRISQGLTINISYDRIERLIRSLPDRYWIVEARDSTGLLAVSIFCSPSKDIIYYYLPASDINSKRKGGMIHLMNWAYRYFGDLGFKIMDLGISSIDGTDQEGLVKFKERMGAESTPRTTFDLLV